MTGYIQQTKANSDIADRSTQMSGETSDSSSIRTSRRQSCEKTVRFEDTVSPPLPVVVKDTMVNLQHPGYAASVREREDEDTSSTAIQRMKFKAKNAANKMFGKWDNSDSELTPWVPSQSPRFV